MQEYLQAFFEEFAYPEEAAAALTQAHQKICEDTQSKRNFDAFLKSYEADKNCDLEQILAEMVKLSETVGVHRYTGSLLLFICLSKTLKQYYLSQGLDENIWYTSMCDLKWKMLECWDVHGIWGSFVGGWFIRFFRLTCFGIGKLQFELKKCYVNYKKHGVCLTTDSDVINVHIPRTGERLDRDGQRASYEAASAFFRQRYGLTQPVFVCDSWLLYPRNKEVLSPWSNLYQFISDFDIVKQGEYDDYSEVWRLFDIKYQGDVELLPQNTSLRRAYAEWIRKGEKTGWGYGIYLYHVPPEHV